MSQTITSQTTNTPANALSSQPDSPQTHSLIAGYIIWIFGFTGSHRFYYGKPITGTIWLFTAGLFLIGWLIDLFLIPSMQNKANARFIKGSKDFNIAWILITFLGYLGIHRMYMGKWLTGLVYLLTFGIFYLGVIYDYWTLNEQLSEVNQEDSLSLKNSSTRRIEPS